MVGNSHPEVAYNDSLISNFKNIASSGEAYLYSYYKLKKVLEQNNEIETVFVEYTNVVVDSEMNEWTWGNTFISKYYPNYGSFFNFRDTGLLLKTNLKSLINNFSVLNKKNLLRGFNNDYDFKKYLGGYKYKEPNNFEKKVKTLTYEINKHSITDTSMLNIDYLQEIVQLCLDHNKNICFIRTPQHRLMKMRNNEKIFLEIYNENFNNIPLLDFNNYIMSDSDFIDTQHLNHKGANKISKKLNALLKTQNFLKDFFENTNRVIINE